MSPKTQETTPCCVDSTKKYNNIARKALLSDLRAYIDSDTKEVETTPARPTLTP